MAGSARIHDSAEQSAQAASALPLHGGCASGALRFRLERAPMFVHCCHCTRCQRETGGPIAHHAMIEFTAMSVLSGEPEFVNVPTDNGTTHWVARCVACRTALWNDHGSRQAITRYVRVGTLDEPSRLPPQAHIYVRSKQPWSTLSTQTPVFNQSYGAAKLWPPQSLVRYAAAKAAEAAKVGTVAAGSRTAARKAGPAAQRSKKGRSSNEPS